MADIKKMKKSVPAQKCGAVTGKKITLLETDSIACRRTICWFQGLILPENP